jgi:predicted nucleic acid-binding protein
MPAASGCTTFQAEVFALDLAHHLASLLAVHPVTLVVAQLAGKIEGEQAAHGISIAFEDLLIGGTALHLGYSVATLNARHFRLIPSLSVVQL